jgi:hypothetical protein
MDNGQTWSREPDLMFAHPQGGSQDPFMVKLEDGSIVATSYAWRLLTEKGGKYIGSEYAVGFYGWQFASLGGYLLRSEDKGHTWNGPIIPPELSVAEGRKVKDTLPGLAKPAFNRGAMVQGKDGKLYWSVASRTDPTSIYLLVSEDKGLTWIQRSCIAEEGERGFSETSLIETASGDLIGFSRTQNMQDHGVLIRSKDKGETWQWEETGITGHPYHMVHLFDDRIFLVYGYRHEPFGIRARILDPECADLDTEELIIREDGGSGDLGYPWSSVIDEKTILSVYYMNHDNEQGNRYIAGSFIDIS